MMTHVTTLSLLLLSIAVLPGCKNRPKPTPPPTAAPQPAPVEPKAVTITTTTTTTDDDDLATIELDPAKPIAIEGWWDNGTVLLEIDFDYSYRIRSGRSQLSPIVERGRWTRVNHAEFYLEPYATERAKRERVALSIEDGVPNATIQNIEPFSKLPRAPQTIGEEIEGTWRGARGTIAFDRIGTYLLEQRSNPTAPIQGSWKLEHGALVLTPQDPSKPPLVLLVQRTAQGKLLRLQDVEGPLLPFKVPQREP